MGNSHSQSRPVLLSRTPVERPFAQPSNRVLPTAETPRLRPTDNGSILHSGGTLRRRAHSEPELSTLDREPEEEEEEPPPRGPAAALAPSQARIRSRKKARAPQPPRRPLPPLPAADGRYEKHRAKSLDRLPREALCEAIEEAARKRRNSSFKMSLQHPAERGYPPERGQAHSNERGKMHSAERGQMYSVERGQGYTVERGQVHHSSERGHRTEREKVHSAGPPADRGGLFFSAERTSMLQELRSRTERVPPHSTERSQTYSTDNLQGHSIERDQAHSVERSQTHSVERSRAHSVERSRAHSVERNQAHSVERSQVHSVERSQAHSVEHSTNRRSDYHIERGNAYSAERGRVQSKERSKFHPGEKRKVHAAERTRAQSSERLQMYPPEILQTHPPDRERVRPATQWSSSSSLSGSEEELEIDLQLRPTLPRRLVEVSRFSPTDVWKSINLDFFKAHQTRSDPSSEDELLEEQRIRRVSRPVAPRRPAAASADSGISEPPWVPQQDLPAEEESESGGSEPAPPGRGPPTFTLMFPSRSLPRPPQAEPPSRSSRPRGLRRALGLRERGSGKEVERRLDPNWSLSRSLPNVVYLPGERRFAYPGGAERGRFAFQSTARREERAAMKAALAAEAAGRERRRQQEIDWMNRVEEEFRKQRDKEKQGIRLQLRALQETTTGMKKWLKRSPRPDPEGGRSEGEDCNELYNSRNKRNIDDNFKCGISNENYDLSTEVSQRENKAPNKKNYSPPKNEDEKPVSRRKIGRELNSFSRNHPHRGRLQQRILSC